jgi:hypothetical protein
MLAAACFSSRPSSFFMNALEFVVLLLAAFPRKNMLTPECFCSIM